MTVLTTRVPARVTSPVPVPVRHGGTLRRLAGAVLRWTIAIVLIVVLGELMTPPEARLSVRSAAAS